MTDEELMNAWRGAQTSTPRTDWIHKTWRRRKLLRDVGLLAEYLGGGGAIAVAAWFVYRSLNAPTLSLLVLVIVIVAASWWMSTRHYIMARSGAQTHETKSYLSELLRVAQLELEFTRAYTRLTMITLPLIMLWAMFQLYSAAEVYASEPWRAIIGLGGIMSIGAGMIVHARHKCARLEDEVERLQQWAHSFAP